MPQSVRLKYTVDLVDGTNYVVLNLPSGLTIQQRKLHRSCMNYTINGGYVYDTNNNCRVKIGVAPDNWTTRAAIKRVRNKWLEMHGQVLKQNPALKPKWHDFKMMLTEGQAAGTTTTYNVPEDIEDVNLPHDTRGITFSEFVTQNEEDDPIDTNRDEFTAHLLGNSIGQTGQWVSVGAIQSWLQSRPDLEPVTTVDPNEADAIEADPFNLLFDAGGSHDEIIENYQNAHGDDGDQEGDIFPMYHTRYPPMEVMEVAAAQTTQLSPISYFTGFEALLGQVWLKIDADVAPRLDIIPGLAPTPEETTGKVDIVFDVNPRGEAI